MELRSSDDFSSPRLIGVVAASLGTALFTGVYAALVVHARAAFSSIAVGAFVAGAGIAGLIVATVAVVRRLRADRRAVERALEEKERDLTDCRHQLLDSEAGRHDIEAVAAAMPASLFIIDFTYLIQDRYTPGVPAMLGQEGLAGTSFLNVLQRLLSDRLFRTSRDYLELLFDEAKKERTLVKINPLEEVETHAGSSLDRSVRYLSFAFRRIVEADRIARVLVTVEDVTQRVLRERALRESERQHLKQFELLIGILHVAPAALDTFVAAAKEQLQVVSDALRAQDFMHATTGQTALLQQRLDLVMGAIHVIKGLATMLRLDHFERRAAAFELKIGDLRSRPALGGDDFLTLVIEQGELRADLDDLHTLRVKLAGLQRSAAIAEHSGDDVVTNIETLAKSIAARLGKEVRVDAGDFDTRALPPALRATLRDVLIQLVRNSIAHGIERGDEREAAGKPRAGAISIDPLASLEAGRFGFVFRDDGRGLDPDAIRTRAVELELLDATVATSIDDAEIAAFIFTPGFSTGAAGEDAGRGMGMSVIKKRIVDDAGGEIGMSSEVGCFCEFRFIVPVSQLAHA